MSVSAYSDQSIFTCYIIDTSVFVVINDFVLDFGAKLSLAAMSEDVFYVIFLFSRILASNKF